jgi:AbrB family looped-hinge helix DNA binding protein
MSTKSPTPVRERIGRVGQRRQIVIPREIFDKLQMREGDFVAFSQKDNGVLLKPKRVVDPEDALTPAETKRLRRSLKQTQEGKTRPWPQIKHELGL